jgi:hypothetical protein
MKLGILPAFLFAIAFAGAAVAQDSGSAPPANTNAGQSSGQRSNGEPNGGYGRRGGGFGMGMGGRGTMGTVTEVAADHFSIKTETGDVYTVHFDANTRIVKQPAGMGKRGQGEGAVQGNGGAPGMGGFGGRGNPPEQIKASDIKAGDMIRVMGSEDATAKTVTATAIMQLDPATVQQIHEMMANFGKTWLMGKVMAIDGTKITLTGSIDNAPHTVVADENTTFRRRRDPITLADIQVGDMVRVDGALKDGAFAASTVNVGGMAGERIGGTRNATPQ